MSNETQDILNRRAAISVEINSHKVVLDRTYIVKTDKEKEELREAKRKFKASCK